MVVLSPSLRSEKRGSERQLTGSGTHSIRLPDFSQTWRLPACGVLRVRLRKETAFLSWAADRKSLDLCTQAHPGSAQCPSCLLTPPTAPGMQDVCGEGRGGGWDELAPTQLGLLPHSPPPLHPPLPGSPGAVSNSRPRLLAKGSRALSHSPGWRKGSPPSLAALDHLLPPPALPASPLPRHRRLWLPSLPG